MPHDHGRGQAGGTHLFVDPIDEFVERVRRAPGRVAVAGQIDGKYPAAGLGVTAQRFPGAVIVGQPVDQQKVSHTRKA
jgi:hypothetical protein